jgi:hypothetical protein
MVDDVGLASAQDGCVLLLQSAIGGERSRVSWASDQFYAPDRRRLARRRGYAGDEHGNLATRDGLFRLHLADSSAAVIMTVRRMFFAWKKAHKFAASIL